jgi:hypothetical protein
MTELKMISAGLRMFETPKNSAMGFFFGTTTSCTLSPCGTAGTAFAIGFRPSRSTIGNSSVAIAA